MNHALLPSVAKAPLPVKYEAATLAIAECARIDECREWENKAEALASYARQSGDKTLENTAMKIRARAVRRCGELLKEIDSATGAHLKRSGADPLSRKQAAEDAGMSPRQAKDAIRVANVPAEKFEEQVESESPPTKTALAEQGKKPANGVPQYEKMGMTRTQFQAGMYFRGDASSYLEATRKYSVEDVAEGTPPKERTQLRKDLEEIAKYTGRLITKL